MKKVFLILFLFIGLNACFGTTGWEYDQAHKEAGCGEKSKEFRKNGECMLVIGQHPNL